MSLSGNDYLACPIVSNFVRTVKDTFPIKVTQVDGTVYPEVFLIENDGNIILVQDAADPEIETGLLWLSLAMMERLPA